MINTKELRQGNKVMVTFTEDQVGFGKDYIGEIVAVIERKVRVKDDWHWIELDGISPIPLTPEILEKAGFVTIGRYAIGVGGYNVFAKGRIELLQPNEGDPYILAFYEAKITHLHQLQNLYFALTGQELTINL